MSQPSSTPPRLLTLCPRCGEHHDPTAGCPGCQRQARRRRRRGQALAAALFGLSSLAPLPGCDAEEAAAPGPTAPLRAADTPTQTPAALESAVENPAPTPAMPKNPSDAPTQASAAPEELSDAPTQAPADHPPAADSPPQAPASHPPEDDSPPRGRIEGLSPGVGGGVGSQAPPITPSVTLYGVPSVPGAIPGLPGRPQGPGSGGFGAREALAVHVQRVEVSGALSVEAARRVFTARRAAVRMCYERAWRAQPGLEGLLALRLTVEADGRVSAVETSADTLGDAGLAGCVHQIVRRLRFAPVEDGARTTAIQLRLQLRAG